LLFLPEYKRCPVFLAVRLEDGGTLMEQGTAVGESQGRVSGSEGAAGKLGLLRTTLESRIKSCESTSIGSPV
jgi:hypothetical protein